MGTIRALLSAVACVGSAHPWVLWFVILAACTGHRAEVTNVSFGGKPPKISNCIVLQLFSL